MMDADQIYVVLASNDVGPYRHKRPEREDNPIVFETNINGATREAAKERAAQAESQGYGACRIARLVFEDVDGSPL